MEFVREVYEAIKCKKSNEACAQRLKIPLSSYLELKSRVLEALSEIGPDLNDLVVESLTRIVGGEDIATVVAGIQENQTQGVTITRKEGPTEQEVNIDKGTMTVTGVMSTEPKTPEEIVRVLKIDTTRWKLSTFWNKEQADGTWRISALVTAISREEKQSMDFVSAFSSFRPKSFVPVPSSFVHMNEVSDRRVCGVISLQDMHFGKPGNENMGDLMKTAVLDLATLAYRSYYVEELILIIGADTLNMDTFDGTTTKGTLVENSELATKVYIKAFDATAESINILTQFCKTLRVVFIPGNHDRLSSYHLLHALSVAFRDHDGVIFDTAYAERKVFTYGANMICTEHGDVSRKTTPVLYASEFPQQWGQSRYRILYTGHYHSTKQTDFITRNEVHGFSTKILPALSSSDYYHYHNKWTGNKRSATIELHDYESGYAGEFSWTVKTSEV